MGMNFKNYLLLKEQMTPDLMAEYRAWCHEITTYLSNQEDHYSKWLDRCLQKFDMMLKSTDTTDEQIVDIQNLKKHPSMISQYLSKNEIRGLEPFSIKGVVPPYNEKFQNFSATPNMNKEKFDNMIFDVVVFGGDITNITSLGFVHPDKIKEI
jgi:hypothetical protein